jgi:Transposase IS66 family
MDAAGVLPSLGGVAVHDGWSPYWRYPDIRHALCGAHLLRELEGISDEPGQGWAAGMAELLVDVKLAGDRARTTGAGRSTTMCGPGCGPTTSGCWPTGSGPTRRRPQASAAGAPAARPPPTCWRGWIPTATRSCGRWTIRACRSTTTKANATCEW